MDPGWLSGESIAHEVDPATETYPSVTPAPPPKNPPADPAERIAYVGSREACAVVIPESVPTALLRPDRAHVDAVHLKKVGVHRDRRFGDVDDIAVNSPPFDEGKLVPGDRLQRQCMAPRRGARDSSTTVNGPNEPPRMNSVLTAVDPEHGSIRDAARLEDHPSRRPDVRSRATFGHHNPELTFPDGVRSTIDIAPADDHRRGEEPGKGIGIIGDSVPNGAPPARMNGLGAPGKQEGAAIHPKHMMLPSLECAHDVDGPAGLEFERTAVLHAQRCLDVGHAARDPERARRRRRFHGRPPLCLRRQARARRLSLRRTPPPCGIGFTSAVRQRAPERLPSRRTTRQAGIARACVQYSEPSGFHAAHGGQQHDMPSVDRTAIGRRRARSRAHVTPGRATWARPSLSA